MKSSASKPPPDPLLHCFVGTKAQFIKMAPVMLELQRREVPFRYIDSGQHAAFTESLRKTLGIRPPDVRLREGTDIRTLGAAAAWYLSTSWKAMTSRRWLTGELFPGGGVCLIHGDTLSTLLGLQLAKRARLRVAHIEAGLRSFSLLDPFPEELIRLVCMRWSDLLFAPSSPASRNLEVLAVKGMIHQLPGNTIVDSLRMALAADPGNHPLPPKPYALATCHRFETIKIRYRFKKVLELFNLTASRLPLIFVRHKPTQLQMVRFGLEDCLSTEVVQIEMQDYVSFVQLLAGAQLVLTDGGSIQEECAALGKPCLVLRNRTERADGMECNATLWGFDSAVADAFLSEALSASSAPRLSGPSPSRALVDILLPGSSGRGDRSTRSRIPSPKDATPAEIPAPKPER